MIPSENLHDVVIIGGGPAGLSAALLLGRSLRDVIVCDAGHPRNGRSPALHGFLGHDGIHPTEFLRLSREQLARYETVSFVGTEVEDVTREGTHFVVTSGTGDTWRAKSVLMATGLMDRVPELPDIDRYYGISVHQCPYCDGWENRGKALGVIGWDEPAVELALELRLWSPQITLFTGIPEDAALRNRLESKAVSVMPGKITALIGAEGHPGKLAAVMLEEGKSVTCEALFFSPAQAQHSSLAQRLGCDVEGPAIRSDLHGATVVPGLFVAGNATDGPQLVIAAAAGGTTAAVAINQWLVCYDASYLSPVEPDKNHTRNQELERELNGAQAGSAGALRVIDHFIKTAETLEARTFFQTLRHDIAADQDVPDGCWPVPE